LGDGLVKIGSGSVFVFSNEGRDWYYEWSVSLSVEVNDMRRWRATIIGLIAIVCVFALAYYWQRSLAKRIVLLPQNSVTVCDADAVAISPDGRRIAVTCARDAVYAYQFPELKPLARLRAKDGRAFQAAFAPHKNLLAVAEWAGGVTLWDTTTWKKVTELQAPGRTNAVRFSPDGTWLAASVGADGWCVVAWKKTDRYREVYRFMAQGGSMFGPGFACVDFVDSETLAAGGLDGCVYIWDLRNGRLLHRLCGHAQPVWRIAVVPAKGLIASASLDNTVILWDWQHGRHVAASLGGVVASCPVKGLFAASSGRPPIVLQLLETQGFRIVFSTQVNDQNILDMAFSPDGEYLVTVGNRQTVRVWRLRSP
jgi:WD40 repeat protein